MNANVIIEFLTSIGLKGNSLTEMATIIETLDDLASFQNFICLHDHSYKTNPELVHKYILHLQEKHPITSQDFIDGFQGESTLENRTSVLKSLFRSSVSLQVVNKVSNNINNETPLELWFSKLMEFRTTMDSRKAVDLVLFQKELNIL